MKAAIYLRVSSEDQATGGHSLETQRDLCRRYAKEAGFEIVKEYSDSISGATLDRPALVDMLAAAGNEFSVVVCHANDRLSRKPEGMAEILSRLMRADCDLHFVTTGRYDPESPEAVFLLGILSNMANLWRDKIRMNARLGKKRRALRGLVTLNDVPPYGYSMADGVLTVDDQEAEVVRRIFHEYSTAGSTSLEKVVRILLGTPTPTDRGHGPAGFAGQRKTAKGVWNTSMVKRILESPVYSGTWVYGKTRKRYDGVRVKNGETITVDVPPIVSKATQEKAIARLAENRGRRDGRAKVRNYLLQGHIRCGVCGLSYGGSTTVLGEIPYAYYRCGGKLKKSTLDGINHRCDNWTVRAEWLEQQARMFLIAIYSDPEYIKALVARAKSDKSPAAERLETINSRLAQLAGKRQRYLSALENVSGKSGKDIGQRLAEVDEDEARLRAERRELESSQSVVRFRDEDMAEALESSIRGRLSDDGVWYGPPVVTESGEVEMKLGVAYYGVGEKVGEWVEQQAPEEITKSYEFTRQKMRECGFRATVLGDSTVDFSATIPGKEGLTKVQSNVLAFWSLKRPG